MNANKEKRLSKRQRDALQLRDAMGGLHVLAVGVSDYRGAPDFTSLPTGESDASSVANCFRDVHQLNADDITVIPDGKTRASRGSILRALQKLADSALADDRLLFYFSGHGTRLNVNGRDVLHLVPEDAYSGDEPDALVSYDRVQEILNTSPAKQKLVMLDACLSGPNVNDLKVHASTFSRKSLVEYVANTRGVAVLASSPDTGASTTHSPNPSLSLMTHFLVLGLNGTPEALDEEQHLTLSSLYGFISTHVQRAAKSYGRTQQPVLETRTTGEIVLGDFSLAIVDPDSFDIGAFPILKIEFISTENIQITEVLTRLTSWHYSSEYLEGKANEALPEHLARDLGKKVPAIRRAMGFAPGTVAVDGASINFPGGEYTVSYSHSDGRKGRLVHRVSFTEQWFARSSQIPKLIESLELWPDEIELQLRKSIAPEKTIPGLEAKGWTITSEHPSIEAVNSSRTTMVVDVNLIALRGLSPSEIFGAESKDPKALQLAGTLTRLLSG